MHDFQLRLNVIIKEEIAKQVSRKLDGGLFLTITFVNTNKDGTRADIHYIIYPETAVNKTKCQKILWQNKFEIQRSIFKKHRLQKIPTLNFNYDDEYAKINKIDEALNIIDDERSKA